MSANLIIFHNLTYSIKILFQDKFYSFENKNDFYFDKMKQVHIMMVNHQN